MKRLLLNISFSIVALLVCCSAFAQQYATGTVSVSARVVDEFGDPVQGAIVISSVRGASQVTDKNGAFTIESLYSDYLNVVSKGLKSISVFAKVDEGAIEQEEILLSNSVDYSKSKANVAYGTLDFDRLTGAVDRISGEELSIFPSHYAEEALAGRLSGVKVDFAENSPEAESFNVTLRNESLATYVDGLPQAISSSINEIEEVVVAKDFGSTALFGPAATTGAMMVKTKMGNPGEFNVGVSLATGARRPVQLPELMDSYQYASYINQALVNDGRASGMYNQEALDAYKYNTNPIMHPNHNYYEELLDNPALYQDVNANIAGGNEIVQYYSHLGYYGTSGLESVGYGRSSSKFRLNNNVNINIGKYVDVTVGIGGDFSTAKGPSRSSNAVFSTIYNYPSNAIPWKVSEDVYAYTNTYSVNLLADLAAQSNLESQNRNSYSRLGLTYDLSQLLNGLSFNALVGLSVENTLTVQLNPTVSKAIPSFYADGNGGYYMELNNYVEGASDATWSRFSDAVVRNTYSIVGFNHDYASSDKRHQVNTTLNFSYNESSADSSIQFNRDQVYGLRSNYMFDGKYTVEGNLMLGRARTLDASARDGLFYTGGVAWLMHKEGFLSDVSWIDYLKFRATAGLVGVSFFQIGSDVNSFFLYDNLMSDAGGAGGSFGTEASNSVGKGRVRSFTAALEGNLSWPKRLSYNAGFDFTMFQGHLQGQLNYFYSRYFDQLALPTELYSILGSNKAYLPYENFVDTQSQGFDARLTYRNNIGEFKYTVDLTAMYCAEFNNQINMYDYADEYSYRNQNNSSANAIYGLEAIGLFESEADIASHPHQAFGSVRVGDIQYKDFNKDGIIDENDYHEIGKTPRFNYGLNIGLQYKNFGLWINTDGALGGIRMNSLSWDRTTSNMIADMGNAYPVSNKYPRASIYDASNNERNSTFWSVNASYLNLRSVTFGYDLPKKLISRMNMNGIKFYVAGKNLATLSYDNLTYPLMTTSGYTVAPVLNAVEFGADIIF